MISEVVFDKKASSAFSPASAKIGTYMYPILLGLFGSCWNPNTGVDYKNGHNIKKILV